MTQQYLSEVRMMSFNFAPKGWAFCNGQLMAISQNQALFSLLGTTYGGDGIRTFGLPNLQGRVPLSYGTATDGTPYALGQTAGEATHTLLLQEIAQHTHLMQGKAVNGIAGGAVPDTAVVPAQGVIFNGTVANGPANIYSGAPAGPAMAPNAIANEGGSQPHANQQPYQVINFCIALTGIFPSRS
jgi:microcystin-dependent protein